MSLFIKPDQIKAWPLWQKILFKWVIVFVFLLAIPLSPWYFKQLLSINPVKLDYRTIFRLAHYFPDFTGHPLGFINWLVIILVAIAGVVLWGLAEKKAIPNYSKLYNLAWVAARYRLAAAIIVYGFLKWYPMQSPYPSISHLNTRYGDFTSWKIFSLTLGIVPSYQSFLGGVELVCGLLLLYRKTASIGAFIFLVFDGNVLMSNLAYEGGEYIYCAYLLLLALFILSYDFKRLYQLLILRVAATPSSFRPYSGYGKKVILVRQGLRALFIILFVAIYGLSARNAYARGGYKYPPQKGIAALKGLYRVSVFVLNGDTIPYHPADPVRWRDVVFEEWSTISIASNRKIVIDSFNQEHAALPDTDRNYESEGSSGRQYYRYIYEPATGRLQLNNKNTHAAGETLLLRLQPESNGSIQLSGVSETGDSLRVLLHKQNKKYLLEEAKSSGRRGNFKL